MPRYLVCHDYGMGGLWWWITADSEADILERIAEVEVVADPAWLDRCADDLAEVELSGWCGPRSQRTGRAARGIS